MLSQSYCTKIATLKWMREKIYEQCERYWIEACMVIMS